MPELPSAAPSRSDGAACSALPELPAWSGTAGTITSTLGELAHALASSSSCGRGPGHDADDAPPGGGPARHLAGHAPARHRSRRDPRQQGRHGLDGHAARGRPIPARLARQIRPPVMTTGRLSSQCERLLAELQDGRHLTQLDALHQLGIGRLASRVHDLRKAGWPVRDRTIGVVTTTGTAHVSEYWIDPGSTRSSSMHQLAEPEPEPEPPARSTICEEHGVE